MLKNVGKPEKACFQGSEKICPLLRDGFGEEIEVSMIGLVSELDSLKKFC